MSQDYKLLRSASRAAVRLAAERPRVTEGRTHSKRFLRSAVGLLFALGVSSSPGGAETLESVLARIDREAGTFRDLTARLQKTTHTAVLNDTSQESGTVWIKRSGARDLIMRIEFTEPNPRALGFEGSKGQIYYPKIQTVQIYDLGKNRSLVDQFLLLGFGTSGRDVAKNYTMKVIGEETVGGEECTHLELTPKSSEVLQYIQKVELWIPHTAGHPVQQKILQPGGDYMLIAYSEMQWNPRLQEGAFRLNLPKGVKREYPQK